MTKSKDSFPVNRDSNYSGNADLESNNEMISRDSPIALNMPKSKDSFLVNRDSNYSGSADLESNNGMISRDSPIALNMLKSMDSFPLIVIQIILALMLSHILWLFLPWLRVALRVRLIQLGPFL
ncbi:hypothetical protein Cni_G19755 [Canna indica]|uniref:Uncharacterized protein n=1 Tax=Canna indica TaxID=4628 RepID=A0AAQ3QH76_9LILI|nr:hypothetical protein Cni_G19755 [Canna indica]